MPMCNLLENSDNYSMTSESLWNYYRDATTVKDATNKNDGANYRVNNYKTATCKSFEYKTKIIGKTQAVASRLDKKVAFTLKDLSNFGDLLICL